MVNRFTDPDGFSVAVKHFFCAFDARRRTSSLGPSLHPSIAWFFHAMKSVAPQKGPSIYPNRASNRIMHVHSRASRDRCISGGKKNRGAKV